MRFGSQCLSDSERMWRTMTTNEKPTQMALRECTYFLSACLKIGWSKSSLDMLEELWWKYHDHTGRLIAQ